MNWSSAARRTVNGSQRTQRRCELWNGSSIRGCPHFIPPMGTLERQSAIVPQTRNSAFYCAHNQAQRYPVVTGRTAVFPLGCFWPPITQKKREGTPLIMECARSSETLQLNFEMMDRRIFDQRLQILYFGILFGHILTFWPMRMSVTEENL